ncbi:hypothetical protein GZL_00774 [Streptomyces sp. 769]|nr:hypothetical protein GZL_00774 [Streptomyces sp. 769]
MTGRHPVVLPPEAADPASGTSRAGSRAPRRRTTSAQAATAAPAFPTCIRPACVRCASPFPTSAGCAITPPLACSATADFAPWFPTAVDLRLDRAAAAVDHTTAVGRDTGAKGSGVPGAGRPRGRRSARCARHRVARFGGLARTALR